MSGFDENPFGDPFANADPFKVRKNAMKILILPYFGISNELSYLNFPISMIHSDRIRVYNKSLRIQRAIIKT